MRFPCVPALGANHDRFLIMIRVLKRSLIAMLAVAAMDAYAGSAMIASRSDQNAAAAQLMFKIVIPAVLILDTRSGTVYSNDAKAIVSIGATGAPPSTMRADQDAPLQAGLRPVVAMNGGRNEQGHGASGARLSLRRIVDGDVICIP